MRTVAALLLACVGAHARLLGGAASYTNPVSTDNTPDPGVLFVNGTWIVTTTGGDAGGNFPIHVSRDLVTYKQAGYVFPAGSAGNPKWAVQDFWAPEVHKVGSTYNVYFVGRNAAGVLSVGVGTSASPTGPFKDIGAPLFTQPAMGNIDPTFFHDDATGRNYLIWKRDGNAVGQATPIFLAELDTTGTRILTNPLQLITNDEPWEGVLVEAPWMVFREGYYYLFYSGNIMQAYAVGVARATNVTGPFTKKGAPFIVSQPAPVPPATLPLIGPGHCSVVQLPDLSWMMWYHTWKSNPPVTFADPRYLSQDQVVFSADGWPQLAHGDNPSSTPQPIP